VNKLVVALGNPGSQYLTTRHNVAWMVFDHLKNNDQLIWRDKFKGEFATQGEHVFLKPLTFMNLSGESVAAAAQFFKIAPRDILVIHDELDLPYGTVALKRGGGLAGHNGLKSIAALLGTNDFLRLRVGIGRPSVGSVSNWVLSPFSAPEQIQLTDYLDATACAVELYLSQGFDKAASRYSRKTLIETP
jgi:peptidyl-tRNA hydrolase, PTH1 family